MNAELVVQRGDDQVGVLVPLKVVLDGRVVARLTPNQTVRLVVVPGEHIVRAGRSKSVPVSASAGEAVHVLVGHPPMPSYWRLVLRPFRSSRPSVALMSRPAPVPGPGEPTAAEAWLRGWVPSFVTFSVWLRAGVGIVLAVCGVLLGVLGRGQPFVVVMAAVLMLMGLGMAGVSLWLRGRLARLRTPMQ